MLVFISLIFGFFLQSYANDIYKYIGVWKDSNAEYEMIFKDGGRCSLKKKSKILIKQTECFWNQKEHLVTYGKANKKDTFYFKLDNNELIIEQDKRSLTRAKADLILHKAK